MYISLVASALSGFPPKPRMHSSSLPCQVYAWRISSFFTSSLYIYLMRATNYEALHYE
jgi:hypothetical protein